MSDEEWAERAEETDRAFSRESHLEDQRDDLIAVLRQFVDEIGSHHYSTKLYQLWEKANKLLVTIEGK